MGFVKNTGDKTFVGKWVTTIKKISSYSGYFTVGSRVRLTYLGERGYDVEDSEGNQIYECGFNFFNPQSASDHE